MSDASRQKARRQRLKEAGMVDIRVDVPITTRDRLRKVAQANGTTMKDVIRQQLELIN